jgi:hypothetical protein
MNTGDKPYRHVVLFKFKKSVSEETLRGIEGAFRDFAARLPFVTGFEWGRNTSPENLDHGYTHCFIVTFRNEADRDLYLPHPGHKAFIKDYLDANLEDACVLDFRAQD